MSSQAPIIKYYQSRLDSLSLSKDEALKYGILSNKNDDIELLSRSITGDFAEKVLNSKRVKTGKLAVKEFIKTTRFNPSYLAKNKDCPKYLFEKGYNLLNFMPLVCDAYNASKQIDTLTIQEGTFKAVAHDKNGLFALNANGILNYKLTPQLKELILKTKPKQFNIFHDGDFNKISTKGDVLSDKRVRMFLISALNFANQLFRFLEENNLKCKVFYSAVNPCQDAKGFDDLLEQERSNKNKVIDAFKSSKDSEYFIFRKLCKTTVKDKLEQLLNISSLEQFYEANNINVLRLMLQRVQVKRHFY